MDVGMRNFARAVLLGAATLAATASLATSAPAQADRPVVVQLGLRGVVDPFTANYISGGIARAEAQGYTAGTSGATAANPVRGPPLLLPRRPVEKCRNHH